MNLGIQVKFVMIPVFTQITGYTEKAVRRKIEENIWRNGKHYRRSPDGHIHMDMPEYYKWIENGHKTTA
jgi:hypothetical protein